VAEFFAAIAQLSVPVFLVSRMSQTGPGLTLQQILSPLRNARLVVFALLANFVVAPLLAVSMARLLRLDGPYAQGLPLLGLAAGAPFVPKIAGMAKGDVAVAVGLTVMLMVGTIVLPPLVLPLLVNGAQVNPLKTARSLILPLLLPLTVGMIVRARAASIAVRLARVPGRVPDVTLPSTIVLIIALRLQRLLCIFGTGAIYAGFLFSVLAALSGWLLGGGKAARRTVLGLGTGLRNFPAASIASGQDFSDPGVSAMVIVCKPTALVVLLHAARLTGKHELAALQELDGP
jgi:BASS family bile acid:Na+ symporter